MPVNNIVNAGLDIPGDRKLRAATLDGWIFFITCLTFSGQIC
jgi:hypothetical protein